MLEGNNMEHILTGDEIPEDSMQHWLRPAQIDDFQGQRTIKDNLMVFIQAAIQRNESLDHVLLSGPPGLGKTTLAAIIAHEMKTEFRATSAPTLEKPKDIAGILTTLTDKSILFVDEIHRMRPALEEMLYSAMEDQTLDWIIGQGPSARTIRIPLPSFTLVGATTRPGTISAPLSSRFGIHFRLDYYDENDISNVIRRSAKILEIQIEESCMSLLAQSSRGTPRIANRILKRMRDFAQVEGRGIITPGIMNLGMTRLDIDTRGLESQDRAILLAIIQKYGGGPVGAETLAITVGETVDSLEDFYEPYLIRQGYLKRTSRGRMATSHAYQILGLESLASERREQELFELGAAAEEPHQ